MNVALLGFGTVGQAVARLILASSAPLTLTHICNRQVARKRVDWVPPSVAWTERFEDLLGPEVDLIVEVIGGLDPAGRYHRAAIAAKKSVVTANKQLIAHEGGELLRLASQQGVHFGFEAAVAGGIPVIRAIREGLAGDSLKRISGILNGTCNYMLTRMEAERISFDAVLADAQAKGFAEADPTDDLDGYDARAKLCVLARIGLHVALRPDDVPCRSIRPLKDVDFVYARRLGYTIRQVSRVEHNDGGNGVRSVDAAVEPALVKNGSVLSRVRGSENLVLTAGRARLRNRVLRPRRRRRSDGGRGPLRRPVDRPARVASRLVRRSGRRSAGHRRIAARLAALPPPRRARQAGHHRGARQRPGRATT